tara:strand:- start:3445 stop:4473 length:1029 start_codon:yes stop_codon:yes gene_type:complete
LNKILVIRFSSIGDIIFTTYALQLLKQKYPKSKIYFLTLQNNKSILKNISFIYKIITIEKKSNIAHQIKSFRKLNNHKFSKIYDLHGSLRSFLVKILINSKSFTIRKLRIRRFILFNFKINLFKKKYDILDEIEQLLDINKSEIFLKNKTYLNVSSREKNKAKKILESNKIYSEYIVIVPGANWENKSWTLENYNKLIPLLKFPIVLLGSENDLICDKIYKSNKKVINLKNKTDLRTAFSIIFLSKITIGSDTGLVHASEALGKPVVLISGPTSNATGGNTRNKKSKNLYSDIWCRPCSKNGQKKCIRDKKYCMININEMKVLNSINEIIKNDKKNNLDISL